jgi:putative transferase (TIGR04331 family)
LGFIELTKERRFLITTAIERTWVENQPIVFLGEWCRVYGRESRWAKLDALCLPYHWNNRDIFFSDYRYLNELYDRLLLDLSIKLNEIHGVDHGQRYWRIFVGPWLAYFIQILFDRWENLQGAMNAFEIDGTIALTGREEDLVPNDMDSFVEFIPRDDWNHYIYAELLHSIGHIEISYLVDERQNCKVGESKASFKTRLRGIYTKATTIFRKHSDTFLLSTYLLRWDEILLSLRLRQLPYLLRNERPQYVPLDFQKRIWGSFSQGCNEFENILLAMIPRHIPRVFLEGYDAITEKINLLDWPRSPKLIYAGNSLLHNSVAMAYTAQKVENGAFLVCGQHGGGYGTAQFHFAEEHEIEISDRYLTWGWRDAHKEKSLPMGIVKIPKKKLSSFNSRDTLLFISMTVSRYSFRLCAESAINYEKYIDRSFTFVSLLNRSIFSKTLVRLSPIEMGMCLPKRWRDRFPLININNGNSCIYSLFMKSRIVLQTYNQTGFLESVAMGIPTVLLADLKETPLRDAAVPFYAELKRVRIFHDTPESAAEHINAIWGDVDSWWTSVEVQEVVASFKSRYCYCSGNIVERIENIIREAIVD